MGKYTRGLLAVILAVVLVLPAAAFAMLPEANARSSTGMDGPAVSGTVVDPDTSGRWEKWAAGHSGNKVTTQNVGRIWTDKTVMATEGNEESDFLTTLSAMSSTSNSTVTVTTPLDIVMVLDASGSMDDHMGGGDSPKRIDALKSAANSFIDTIAKQNESIEGVNRQHRVAIVKFAGKKSNDIGNNMYRDGGYSYNYTQVMKELTYCSGSNADDLKKNTINQIQPAGATRADYGLELAEKITTTYGRKDAKKIIVFFTDGTPTKQNKFDAGVANAAVTAAKNMKDGKATVYTIGIFDGANPSAGIQDSGKSQKENKFMQAVSSNYPNATAWDAHGACAENSDYYKSATDAEELKKVFDDISQAITSEAPYPTEIDKGYDATKSGYITFTDELGDFMQVDSFTEVVINGTPFTKASKTVNKETKTDTYEFDGKAKDLLITVQRAGDDNPQKGDVVTVSIPASLIPLSHFKTVDGKLSVDSAQPIRVKYTSSVKSTALDNLFTPEKVTGLKDYIENNTTVANGAKTVNFYANKWAAGDLGNTVATFEPADTNRYYYFQKQTPIYTDKDCTQPAKNSLADTGTYYYKDEFEEQGENGEAKPASAVIEFIGGDAAKFDGAIVADEDGNLSFSVGTARLAFIDELHTTKESVGGNNTGTATDVLNPKWNNVSAKATATHVNSYLGNNGKISFNVTPATVDTKTSFGLIKVLEGREWTDTDKFKFELSATSENDAPMPAPATATVTNADLDKGKAAINFGKITYAKPGEYTYEVREVKGDAGGITYSKNVATFKVTVAVKATGGLKADVEKISGETEFKNTYSAKTETSLTLEATKTLTGRPMADDEFKFALSYAGHDEVLLDATNKGGKVEFGPLTYTTKSLAKLVEEDKASLDASSDKPTWTIHYIAAEQTGKLPAGVSATVSAIDACVTVVDNGDGTLTATAVYGDAGNEFVNTYTAAPAEASLVGKKNLQVPKGLTPADIAGKFTFTVAGEEGAPMPANASVTNDAKGKVDFGKITFTLDDLNKALGKKSEKREHTFTYTVTESGEVAGVTNDVEPSRTVSFTVTDDGEGNLRVSRKSDGDVAFTFTNTYNVTPVETRVTDQITATKFLTGRDMAEGEFSFELVEGEGKDAKVVATGKNAADGKITMSPIEYTEAGTHPYTLREVKGNAGGITYSDAEYGIETTITDNGDGTLSATHVLKDVKVAEFKNSYNVTPKSSSVTDLITADKVLDGRDLKAGDFRFELVEGNNVVATGTNNADGKIVMDPVTYTAAGEHTYILRETKAGTTENGITYSTAEYTIVTTVKDNNDGTLSVEHKLQNVDKATFENAYTVTPKSFSVTDQITATKVLTGRDLKEGEFSFELVEGNDVVATGKNDDRGKIKMSPIEYTAAGKHAYTLCEVPGDANNGITYDGKTYTIETTITDKGDGTLEAKHVLNGADEAKFNNSYKPNPDEFSVTDQITANKVLTGRELAAGEFSFELVEGEGKDAKVVATGKNAADGKITMSPIEYTEAGTHPYTLREVKGNAGGITYSDAKFTIETTITDNGDGTLKAEHVLKDDVKAATFENSYSVTPIDAELDFDLSKAIDGRDWTDADKFSFTVTAPEGTPLPDPATVTVSKKDAEDGIAAIKFGKIHYTAAGTYKYEIRENAGSAAGMTYDAHVATAEVTVTDNGKGVLIANVTKKDSGRFTNTYRTELDYVAAGGLKLSKTLSGRPMTEGQFTFTVTPADEASANALGLLHGANTFKSPATAEATVGLIDILAGHEVKFKQADAGKTFTYTVAEKNDGQPGYTYDEAVRTVTIAIADDGAGTLTATTTVSGGSKGTPVTVYKSGENKVESAVVPFANSYSATTDAHGGAVAQVVATKTLTGRPLADGEFYFGIAYAGEKEAIEGTCVTNVNGQVSFGALHYTTEMLADLVNAKRAIRTDTDAKLAWTINYTAFEYTSPLAAKGITAAKSSFSFKVIVVDNGDGTLTAKPDYGGVEPVFENVYGADAVDAALAGTKKLQAAEGLTPADIAGKFTFAVTADEADAPMPERTTATNDAAGNVDFGKIHFTLDDLNRALGVTTDASGDASSDAEANADEAEVDADASGDETKDESKPEAPAAPRSHTFTYTVTESGSAPGVTNDTNATRKVSYTVTDDGAGHLIVKRDGGDGAAFTFTNTYGVAPTDSVVTDQVKTVKRLTGRDLAAGEFTFDLLEDGVVVASGTNDANGTVTLSPIRYEAPGTHTYTLREACPNALGLYKGVTYDSATYTVVTTVSDNGDGTLTATHKLEGTTESAGFTNKYHAMPTQVSIGAVKVLEGRELKKDEFSFKLVGEDIESTVTNDADGKINFDKFEYDEPGTYVYTIGEVKGDEAGMTYDKSVFTATVNVVDDGEGNLKANVAFTKGDRSVEGIVFNNTYKKPETPVPTPDPGTPKTVTNIVKTVKGFLPTTGDQQAAALLMAFVIAMAGVGALVWGIRKR